MPLSVYFNCPGCKTRIKAPVQLLGTYRNCPGCKTRFMVHNTPRQDAGPLLCKETSSRQKSTH